ncbi:MAG: glycerol kinase, partial [Bacillales bacterium]|nr:glycerol kinase [Bacillales bacterium]
MEKFILTIDQGTTSSRVILFDKKGDIRANCFKETKQYFEKSGWVEQDPEEIYNDVKYLINKVLVDNNISYTQISGIGITNQRETTVIFEKKSGKPIHKAIVWQSRQSHLICQELIKEGYEEMVINKTGLVINPYFSASKILWIFENVPNSLIRASKGELLFGTIDTWLIYKLTNGKVHATDYSNASRTMLFNIHDLKWDEELLQTFKIPRQILPTVYDSSHNYGYATDLSEHLVAITGVAGDQQAALFGQCCFEKGEAKNTYGTGCFLLMNTGNKVIQAKNGLLSTIA